MKTPDFTALKREIGEGKTGTWLCSGTGLHPNPRYWKYDWWVFHKDSPIDGHAFLKDPYRLSTKEAHDLIQMIEASQGLCWLYNVRRPRLDPGNTPFDPLHPRWDGIEWAPAYDDDPDVPMNGHK